MFCLEGKWNQCQKKSINAVPTSSVKRHVKRQQQRQGPIAMHCDAPKWVPDSFLSVIQASQYYSVFQWIQSDAAA